jgi:hypothetical protein
MGKPSFQAGAFELDGRAWGVLGGREMGKSSLLMCLHRAGVPVLSDDLLVINGGSVCAGPRCLDLRQTAAESFDAGEYLGQVGTRERWRVSLPPVRPEVPLAGWVLLGWADEVSITSLPPATRLAALVDHRGLTVPAAGTGWLLDVVGYPMVLFARPKDWKFSEAAGRQLLEELSGSVSGVGDQVPLGL